MTQLEFPRIDSLFAASRPLVSFEFFPPRDDKGAEQLFGTIAELQTLRPSFISITRTGGGTPQTLDLTARIQNELGIRAMAHMTCVGHTAQEMDEYLSRLWQSGVRNVLALRGDLPPGATSLPADSPFSYANDLVTFVRDRHDFCIGVAGYPEGHPQCLNGTRDLEHLKRKLDAGAQFVITQLFFENSDFFRWRDEAVKMGITVPLVAGIMPILSTPQIKRFVTMCGAKIPHSLLLKLEALGADAPAVHDAGVDHAIRQCEELLREDVSGLHFYTLNRSKATAQIARSLCLTDHPA